MNPEKWYNGFYHDEVEDSPSVVECVTEAQEKIHHIESMLKNCRWPDWERQELEKELLETRALFYELQMLFIV